METASLRRIEIVDLLSNTEVNQEVCVKGWIRHFRSNRFLILNDGSTINTIQAVIDNENTSEEILNQLKVGASVKVIGELIESQGKGQNKEIIASSLEIYGEANPEEYPLQPKKHSLEFLREIAHLRPRTNTFSAIYRVRHTLAYAIHKYFNDKGYYCVHTPIITGSDAEGAGEIFKVTTIDAKNPPLTESGEIDYSEDFFGKETNLTVSGQLEAELGALGLGKVYTFGPTFRAENSNTSRHLAEFWMIEPEVAFNDLNDNMDLAEDFLKYCIKYAMDNCKDDIDFLNKRFDDDEKTKPQIERSEWGLIEKLETVLDNDFVRLTYTEAIDILRNCKPNKKKKFKYVIDGWGADLQSEHERYLVEKHFKKPVILTDYPADIKAFYMRQNDDGKTVAAMDILVPGIGELVGGSQREERYDKLVQGMEKFNVDQEELSWYLDTRKFGTVPHAGFGLGFERLVLFVTGMGNIRDVIPFPRAPKSAEF